MFSLARKNNPKASIIHEPGFLNRSFNPMERPTRIRIIGQVKSQSGNGAPILFASNAKPPISKMVPIKILELLC